MNNDDTNIVFAGCLAIIMLILSLFERKQEDHQSANPDMQNVIEEKKLQDGE